MNGIVPDGGTFKHDADVIAAQFGVFDDGIIGVNNRAPVSRQDGFGFAENFG